MTDAAVSPSAASPSSPYSDGLSLSTHAIEMALRTLDAKELRALKRDPKKYLAWLSEQNRLKAVLLARREQQLQFTDPVEAWKRQREGAWTSEFGSGGLISPVAPLYSPPHSPERSPSISSPSHRKGRKSKGSRGSSASIQMDEGEIRQMMGEDEANYGPSAADTASAIAASADRNSDEHASSVNGTMQKDHSHQDDADDDQRQQDANDSFSPSPADSPTQVSSSGRSRSSPRKSWATPTQDQMDQMRTLMEEQHRLSQMEEEMNARALAAATKAGWNEESKEHASVIPLILPTFAPSLPHSSHNGIPDSVSGLKVAASAASTVHTLAASNIAPVAASPDSPDSDENDDAEVTDRGGSLPTRIQRRKWGKDGVHHLPASLPTSSGPSVTFVAPLPPSPDDLVPDTPRTHRPNGSDTPASPSRAPPSRPPPSAPGSEANGASASGSISAMAGAPASSLPPDRAPPTRPPPSKPVPGTFNNGSQTSRVHRHEDDHAGADDWDDPFLNERKRDLGDAPDLRYRLIYVDGDFGRYSEFYSSKKELEQAKANMRRDLALAQSQSRRVGMPPTALIQPHSSRVHSEKPQSWHRPVWSQELPTQQQKKDEPPEIDPELPPTPRDGFETPRSHTRATTPELPQTPRGGLDTPRGTDHSNSQSISSDHPPAGASADTKPETCIIA